MSESQTTGHPKNCLECGLPLGAGREDRKYCNDSCRTAYNNRRRKAETIPSITAKEPDYDQQIYQRDTAAIKKVQDILLSNRVKLLNMFNLYEGRPSRNDFYGFGVNLKYFSSEYTDDEGDIYRMCFDYGYRVDGAHVHIIYNGSEIHFN